jgi:hypothetical protein
LVAGKPHSRAVSEVRDTSQHPLTRTSETKGHEQVFDSGAAYRFEVPETRLWQMVQELQIGGTGSGK